MNITFKSSLLENICCDPDKYGHRKGLDKKAKEELKKVMLIFKNIDNLHQFRATPVHARFNLEKLTNKKGVMSVRLGKKYRLEFFDDKRSEKIDWLEITGIEVIDISNHYGD